MIGYWYTGLMSLLQGRFERWRSGATANTDEIEPQAVPCGCVTGAQNDLATLAASLRYNSFEAPAARGLESAGRQAHQSIMLAQNLT